MPASQLTNVPTWDDMLEEIRDFLNATGDWTIHKDLTAPPSGSGTTAGGRELAISNDLVLAGLRSTTTGPGANRLFLFDGIPPWSSSDLDQMPNNSGIRADDTTYTSAADGVTARRSNPAFAGPFPNAWLFTDDPSTYFHCVIEVEAGKFRHLAFGNMRKFGTWTGGAYYGLTYWDQSTTFIDQPGSGQHHCPFDSGQPSTSKETTIYYDDGSTLWRAVTAQNTLNGVIRREGRGSARGGFGRGFRIPRETPFSGLIALTPITVWSTTSTDTPVTVRPLGQIKDIAEINMANLEAGASYMIGADEWKVFPMAAKHNPTDANDVENSGFYGYAYLVRP